MTIVAPAPPARSSSGGFTWRQINPSTVTPILFMAGRHDAFPPPGSGRIVLSRLVLPAGWTVMTFDTDAFYSHGRNAVGEAPARELRHPR